MRRLKVFLIVATVLLMSGINFSPHSASAWSPHLDSAAFLDFDHNGTIDRVKVVWSGNVTSCKFETGDWPIGSGSIGLTSPTGRLNGAGLDANCDGTTNYFYLLVSGTAGMTGYPGIFAPADIYYKNQGTMDSVTVLGVAASNQSLINIDDNASPVILSTVPTAGSTGVSITQSFVRVTFSEPMETSATSMSISSGSWGPPSWSDENKTLTRSRLLTLPYDTNITVTLTGEDKVGYLFSSGSSPAVINPWTFKTVTDPATTVSATQSTVLAAPTSVAADGSSVSVITVTVNNASGSPISGRVVSLSSTRGALDTITGMTPTTGSDGKAYFQVRSNTAGTSVFTATTGSTIITQTATVTFTSTTPPASSVSSSRSSMYITPSSVAADNTSYATVYVTVRDASDSLLSGKTVTLSSSRGSADTITVVSGVTNASGQAVFQVKSGTSGTAYLTAVADGVTITQTGSVTFTAPVTGLIFGDIFKESDSTAVYYYATDGRRYVFPTQAIYFTWYSGFSGIKTVSHSTVTSIPLGGNVIAKPGTYLVQFVSMDTPFRVLDPKVYALEANGQLRWIATASAAAALYGADWERKIVAVPEVFRTNYIEGGANINSASDYSKASVEAAARTINDTL